MRTCCFCGHAHIYEEYGLVKRRCAKMVDQLILQDQVGCFLVGNYGRFDALASSVCLEAREKYPQIQVCLLLPYYRPEIDESTKAYWSKFDSIITPEFEKIPYRFRILKCNEYMVNQSDIVVAYVNSPGGAAKTLEYAKRRRKRIINIGIQDD